jgi:hypothetical protein
MCALHTHIHTHTHGHLIDYKWIGDKSCYISGFKLKAIVQKIRCLPALLTCAMGALGSMVACQSRLRQRSHQSCHNLLLLDVVHIQPKQTKVYSPIFCTQDEEENVILQMPLQIDYNKVSRFAVHGCERIFTLLLIYNPGYILWTHCPVFIPPYRFSVSPIHF